MHRRDFFKAAGAGMAAAGVAFGAHSAEARPQVFTEKERFDRIASCSYPIRYIFKLRARGGAERPDPLSAELKQKYGEITMLDFPQFTKDTFPGVTHMDIYSGLFGDVSDASMFEGAQFDPASPSGRRRRRRARKCSTSPTTHRPTSPKPTRSCARPASRWARNGSMARRSSARNRYG